MKGRPLLVITLLAASALCFASADGSWLKADGSWLKKVPQEDRARVNPYAGNPEAAAAGRNLFLNNCAKCHGDQAQGKGSRPALRSARIASATDGELAWIIKNGETFKGMPGWGGLPQQERWQLVAYIRSLNTPAAGGQQ